MIWRKEGGQLHRIKHDPLQQHEVPNVQRRYCCGRPGGAARGPRRLAVGGGSGRGRGSGRGGSAGDLRPPRRAQHDQQHRGVERSARRAILRKVVVRHLGRDARAQAVIAALSHKHYATAAAVTR
eukprot:7296032-Prymnesium_polylepis.1